MILYLHTITALIFTLYLIYLWYMLNYIPKSLSQSFYDISKKKGSVNWPFIVVLIICSIDLTYYGWMNWNGGPFPLIIIGGFGILGVSQFLLFKRKWIGIMHYINAMIGFILPVFYFGINLGRWDISITIGIITILTMIFTKKETRTFWVEVILAYCFIISLYLL